MSKSQVFYLTRRAALDLRDIYDRSRREWGEATASRYIADIYASMSKAAVNPDAGLLRKHRSAPFLMVPARKHFVVYDRIADGIAVLAVMYQVRDIESLISNLSPSFIEEIEKLKENKTKSGAKRSEKRKR